MEGVTPDQNNDVSSKDDDEFPKGLRVLVVDDNVTCLHLLAKMLQDCSYRVTKCRRGEEALSMIRENKGEFDIVLADVHMPGMDGLQLLAEIANMGINLPVVMFSSDAEKDTVLKGVNSGACDFLVKPIQISSLKILWQHVLRSNRLSSNISTEELETPHDMTTSSSNNTHVKAANGEENSKSLKRSSEDEADHGQSKSSVKKPRLVWTPELNQVFITAVNSLRDADAKPKKILQIMRKTTGLPHLTRHNVSSHLQKYRANSKKIGEASDHQSVHSSLIKGPGFANLTHSIPSSSSLIGCGGIQNHAASAQYPSQAMSITPRLHCSGSSMRMPNLVEFPDNNVFPRYQMGLQSQPLALLQQSNAVLQNCDCRQEVNESAQYMSYAPVPSVGFTSPRNSNPYPVLLNQSDDSLIMQMLDEAAAARQNLSAATHLHPLHSQISTHDFQSLISNTPHPASEQDLHGPLNTVGAKANQSCGNNVAVVQREFHYQNNHNSVAEDCQLYGNEAIFANALDPTFFDGLGFGEDIPFLDSYVQDSGSI